MWIQSTLGDFSIVKNNLKQEWLIRTRHKEDINKACKLLGLKKSKVIANVTADYKYRISVNQTLFIVFMEMLAYQVEYYNFKFNEQTKRSPKRLEQLYEVYNALKKP